MGTARFKPSGRGNPCPICGRDSDGDCKISDDLILCRWGSTHQPPSVITQGKPGSTLEGSDGKWWAYTGDDQTGEWAVFRPDRPLDSSAPRPGRTRRRATGRDKRAREMATERQAFELLQLAGLGEGLAWNDQDAAWGEFSSRWLEWSGDHPDEASAVLETHATQSPTAESLAEEQGPAGQHPNRARSRNDRPPPLTLAEISDRLRDALDNGASQAEIAQLVPELAQLGDRHPSTIWPILKALGGEAAQAATIAAEAEALAIEADRRDLGSQLTAEYLLPPVLASAVEAVTRYKSIDGPGQTILILSTLAGLCKLGTTVTGCAASSFTVPINLYSCLIGRSGQKKSPPMKDLIERPTEPLISEIIRENRRRREAYEEACSALKKGDHKPQEPKDLIVHTADFTGEALALQLATHEKAGLGLLIYRDELSGVFTSLNQYKQGRGSDEQLLLELFDGSGSRSIRCTGNRQFSRSQLSIVGCTQPDVLRKLVANGDPSGVWARFLFCPLPSRIVKLPRSQPEEVAEVEAAALALQAFARAAYCLPPVAYRLDAEAEDHFVEFEYQRQVAGQAAQLGAQEAIYGKSAGKVLRVAGAMHIAAIVTGELNRGTVEIPVSTLERAIMLVDCLDTWALSLHAQVAAASDSQGADGVMRIVHRASEAAGGPVGWSEIQRRISPKGRASIDGAVVSAAMEALAGGGWGEIVRGARGGLRYQATKPLP